MNKIIICGEEFEYFYGDTGYYTCDTTIFCKNIKVPYKLCFSKKIRISTESKEVFKVNFLIGDAKKSKEEVKEWLEKAYHQYKKEEQRRKEVRKGIII